MCNVTSYGILRLPSAQAQGHRTVKPVLCKPIFISNLFSSLSTRLFWMFLCPLRIFSKSFFFLKILSGIPTDCQTDWIQFRPNILSGLIWLQTVCKGYEQTTIVSKELNKLQGLSESSWHHLEKKDIAKNILTSNENTRSKSFMCQIVFVCCVYICRYSKICVKGPLKNRQNKDHNDKW